MQRFLSLVLGAIVASAAACAPAPPPHWQDGGAVLAIAPARWVRANRSVVELFADGNVEERGRPTLFVDRAGRVGDGNHDPLAVLLPDGLLAGASDSDLGRVGIANASPPGAAYAWLALMPDGAVMRFDSNGDRVADGAWTGCDGAVKRTCTLITHVIAMRAYHDRNGPSVGIGIGLVL